MRLESESEVAQSSPTLCDPMDCSPPGSVHGILQARILEWVAISFSRESSQPRDRTQASHIAGGFFNQLSHKGSPRILEWVAYPFSSGSSRLRDWDPGIEQGSPALQVDSLPTELSGKPFSHNTWECERAPFGCLAGQFFCIVNICKHMLIQKEIFVRP